MVNTCPAKASSYSLRNISVIISSACLSEEEASLGEGFILSLKLFFYVASLDPKEFFFFFELRSHSQFNSLVVELKVLVSF